MNAQGKRTRTAWDSQSATDAGKNRILDAYLESDLHDGSSYHCEEDQDEACYRQFYEEAISLCRQKRFHEALEKCRYTSLDDEEEYSIDVIQPEK